MAKSDQGDIRDQISKLGGTAWNNTQSLQNVLGGQNQQFQNHYDQAFNQNWQDYQNLSQLGQANYNVAQGNYQNALTNYQNIQNAPTRDFGAYGGYQNFANTGGYSPEDIQNIRARGIAPIRGVYSNALANLNRQKALTGGYMPNYAGALSRMSREQAITGSDQATNVEAQLAEQIRQGKLAGLGGMTNIDEAINQLTNQRLGLQNTAMGLETGAIGEQNQALGLQNQLYGETPGLASMTGNQLNTSSEINTNAQQLQNQLMNMIIQNQIDNASKVPSASSQVFGNIGRALNLAGGGADVISAIKKLFGSGTPGTLPSKPTVPVGTNVPLPGGGTPLPGNPSLPGETVPAPDPTQPNVTTTTDFPNFPQEPLPSTPIPPVNIPLPTGPGGINTGNPGPEGPSGSGDDRSDFLARPINRSIFSQDPTTSRSIFSQPNDQATRQAFLEDLLRQYGNPNLGY